MESPNERVRPSETRPYPRDEATRTLVANALVAAGQLDRKGYVEPLAAKRLVEAAARWHTAFRNAARETHAEGSGNSGF